MTIGAYNHMGLQEAQMIKAMGAGLALAAIMACLSGCKKLEGPAAPSATPSNQAVGQPLMPATTGQRTLP